MSILRNGNDEPPTSSIILDQPYFWSEVNKAHYLKFPIYYSIPPQSFISLYYLFGEIKLIENLCDVNFYLNLG